ncbi:MAG TPA: CbrC family protein [Geobacterales bacterium]|nr:CbrC family protein [Geobacterales bacterium]
MELPKFPYHPNPLETGSIEESDAACSCCGKARGYIYTGPVYAEEELDDSLCPWCISDGSANEKFGADFTDFDGIGGHGSWQEVSDDIKEMVVSRTPGFASSEDKWWTHCSDAAEFIGYAGAEEVKEYGADLITSIGDDLGLAGQELSTFIESLDIEGGATAYVFRCRKCGRIGGYADEVGLEESEDEAADEE